MRPRRAIVGRMSGGASAAFAASGVARFAAGSLQASPRMPTLPAQVASQITSCRGNVSVPYFSAIFPLHFIGSTLTKVTTVDDDWLDAFTSNYDLFFCLRRRFEIRPVRSLTSPDFGVARAAAAATLISSRELPRRQHFRYQVGRPMARSFR